MKLLYTLFHFLAQFDLALAKLGGNPDWIESARSDVRHCESVLANLEIQQ